MTHAGRNRRAIYGELLPVVRSLGFKTGTVYDRRQDLYGEYGGQRQGGLALHLHCSERLCFVFIK